ncbi:MAG: hypothetical protein K8T90_21595 [Planctomycetes bacterium]|nr:hypothetical protein [Planctomycetota bacterium]
MSDVPTRSAYTPDSRRRVIHAATTLARTLGDLVERSVVVGGLVPTALDELRVLDVAGEPHIGTLDLDVALAIAIRGTDDAAQIRRRIEAARFRPAAAGNREGEAWRWVADAEPGVILEFLVDAEDAHTASGRIAPVGSGLGALAARGIRLALRAPLRWELQSVGADHAAPLTVNVCAPAPFVVLKSFAVHGRDPGKPKDAYDLDHVLRNAKSRAALAMQLVALGDPYTVRDAMDLLKANFGREDARGPRDLEAFLEAGDDPGLRADCVGFVLELLAEWEKVRRG